jgi:hypothetical protein
MAAFSRDGIQPLSTLFVRRRRPENRWQRPRIASLVGRRGINSNCETDTAPWRCTVPGSPRRYRRPDDHHVLAGCRDAIRVGDGVAFAILFCCVDNRK